MGEGQREIKGKVKEDLRQKGKKTTSSANTKMTEM